MMENGHVHGRIARQFCFSLLLVRFFVLEVVVDIGLLVVFRTEIKLGCSKWLS